jgi:protein ImuB
MALRGCINVVCLPLQILLKDNPGWAGTPVAVTRDEKPQSPILALNREARQKGLAVGMRYANALSIVPSLRARAVRPDRIAEARERIVGSLSAFTPDIEPCPFDTDALWVNVDGLRSLFASESRWADTVRGALAADGFHARVVVGFTRFGTYAIARSRSRSMVFASQQEEYELMSRSSVDILPLSPRTRSTLRKLEVCTVKQFVSLPEGETMRRFGREAGLLRKAILSDDPLPIQPLALKEHIPCRRHLDAPLVDLDLLMPHVDELLVAEAVGAEKERAVIRGLTLILRTEDGEITTDIIRPAVPTRNTPLLSRLILLRLSTRQFSSGVEDIEVVSSRVPPSRAQEELFQPAAPGGTVKGRDMKAGARAFAAIRARFGNDSVSCARLVDSHLPERSFRWEPLDRPNMPTPPGEGTSTGERAPTGEGAPTGDRASTGCPATVRRILFTPAPTRTPSQDMAGPFVVSGRWWGAMPEDAPFLRDYFFHRSEAGVRWIFVDRLTDTSWVQGVVD